MSKVLIVDDNLDNCRMLARLMVHCTSHDVQYVTSGQEALNRIRDDPPGMVLLDMMMPDMSGFDVLRAVQQAPPSQVPIIMFSANSDPQEVELACQLGAKDYLVKGRTTFDELLNVVEKYAGEVH